MIQQSSINISEPLILKGSSYILSVFKPELLIPTPKVSQNINIESAINLRIQRQIECLKEDYIFEKPKKIIQFLLSHKDLIEILLEARGYIRQIFGNVPLYLEFHRDPEEDFECIFLIIKTTLPIEEALDRLDRFDKEYWLHIENTISNILEVTLRPL